MTVKVISVVNQKGGVAKTTTTVNLATALAAMDKKVLVIDLDPQGNSSTGFGVSQQQRKNTIYQALTNIIKLKDTIISTDIPNLEIITSNTNLSAAELDLIKLEEREYILMKLLEGIKVLYDYIIIDCPPSLNLLTINALVAGDEVLIPMQCDFYSLEGLSHLLKAVEIVEKRLNPKIKIAGILFTMYDRRNRLTEQVEEDVRSCLGELVFKTVIPRNIKLSEAPSYGKPAIIYDYKCAGAVAYMELTKEILGRYNEK
ncbi:chromosome partitioning protein ParA [Rickettsia bellii]|uniref:Chromosome partitioning protein ParA n=1 Tax=Rickettsia bellii str. RML An4 TaxID=1359193 RepID=A0A0F3QE20_RICBE|nr:AAA family ATPase [Rickettsia bellii]ARD86104.1 chromosome partitioning protein ParA [Rickettsia bellii]KJV90406.1 cobQ/CobB/MinD/ParA nucleotide binding domain protein [Rickettsia bellii str. RML An4]